MTLEAQAHGTGEALLSIRGLTVEYSLGRDWVPIVHDVSLDVAPNEILGLVGESGSGKTVSSLAAMGLLPRNTRVATGQITFKGRDLLALSKKERRALRGQEMAMIFQDALRCLNPAFTVGDQIAEAVRVHEGVSRRAAMARAVEMLEMVEIPNPAERARAYPHQFSGGMSQRAMIAMALSCSPSLLIADEPTTALDVTVQKQILNLLRKIQAEMGVGILLITHDLAVVEEVCDRTAVMYAGQLVEQGATATLFSHPRHPYTRGLLSAMAEIDPEVRRFGFIPGSVPPPGSWPSGCHFRTRCVHAEAGRCDVDEVIALARHVDHDVRCVRVEELQLLEGSTP